MGLIGLALLVVYVVWGSTYLAIRIVVEEAPPLTSMGARYVLAGLLLATIVGVRLGRSALRITWAELGGCAFLGLMLPLLGNGMVAVAESMGTPSGVAAVLIALTPLMIMLYRVIGGDRPTRWSMLGIALGFVGVVWLVLKGSGAGGDAVPLSGSLVVLFAASCWGFGSWMQPRLTLPRNAFVMTVYEMLCGGVMLLVVGLAAGERPDLGDHSLRVWSAWGYLVIFGSTIAFTAYVWLLANAPISLVSTYAYVNPVVAVALGWLILGEAITPAILVGGGIIVLAVVIVITAERPRRPREGGQRRTA